MLRMPTLDGHCLSPWRHRSPRTPSTRDVARHRELFRQDGHDGAFRIQAAREPSVTWAKTILAGRYWGIQAAMEGPAGRATHDASQTEPNNSCGRLFWRILSKRGIIAVCILRGRLHNN